MEDFIQKIFEIDQEAEDYQKTFENKKNALLEDRKMQFEKLDKEYLKVLEDEKNNLNRKLSEIENKDTKELDEYKQKADKVKSVFIQKKSELIEKFAKSILEGGD